MRRTFLLSALLAAATTASAQQERVAVDTTLAFDKNGIIDLGIVSGEIIVTGWNRNEARISARLEDRGYLETTFTAGRITINARSRRGKLGEAMYELSVPIGTTVRARAVSGDITIRATAGESAATTVSGDIDVRDVQRASLNSVSGDISADRIRGRTSVSTVSGEVDVRDLVGDIDARAVSGTLSFTDARAGNLQAKSVSGDIVYLGSIAPDGSYDLSTHSGDVRIAIPSNAGARISVQTFSGEMRSDFPITLQPGSMTGRRDRKMDFTVGTGGARVSLSSFSGDVSVERAGARKNDNDN
ncbi:MAG: DUF4097 domain-containing protein [Gemmatimonadaceae bacterium]|nr:DUF4097 domain-containing protein [Gemmatimonadaceae bacterium]